jgi:hypothetical protein
LPVVNEFGWKAEEENERPTQTVVIRCQSGEQQVAFLFSPSKDKSRKHQIPISQLSCEVGEKMNVYLPVEGKYP